MVYLFILLTCYSNSDYERLIPEIIDIVDCVELNHCTRREDTILDQLLFYNLDKKGRYELIDYRLISKSRAKLTPEEFRAKEREFHEKFLAHHPHYRGRLPVYYPDYVITGMHPRKNHSTKLYYMMWREGSIWRKVIAKSCVETWTDYDPEIDRMYTKKRKGLSKGPVPMSLELQIDFPEGVLR